MFPGVWVLCFGSRPKQWYYGEDRSKAPGLFRYGDDGSLWRCDSGRPEASEVVETRQSLHERTQGRCLRPTDFLGEGGDKECMIYESLGHMRV